MKKLIPIILVTVLVLSIWLVASWWNRLTDAFQFAPSVPQHTTDANDAGGSTESNVDEPPSVAESSPVASQPQDAQQPSATQSTESRSDTATTQPPETLQLYTEGEQKKHLSAIVRDFEKNLKFPQYSRPLSEKDHSLLNPSPFIPSQRVHPEAEQFSYEAIIPSFRIPKPDPIPIQFVIYAKGQEAVPQVQYVAVRVLDHQQLRDEFELELKSETEREVRFEKQYQPAEETSKEWGDDLTLRFELLLTGYGSTRMTEIIQYYSTVAEVTAVGQSMVNGPHLEIPVELNVQQEGFYLLTGNLLHAENKRPLLHLRGKGEIKGSKGELLLQAHIVALKQAQSEGPYELKLTSVYRLPGAKGESKQYGRVPDEVFQVQAYPFSAYKDQPYLNQDEQNKLELLKRFSSQYGSQQ